MPINQSRLITTANAALLSLRAINAIRKQSRTLTTYTAQETMSYKEAFLFLVSFINSDEELFPETDAFAPELKHIASTYNKIIHTVTEEINHFNRNAERNARSAEYMRSIRNSELKGNPYRKRRKSQPHTIFEASTVVTPENQPPPVLSTSYSKTPDLTLEEVAEMRAKYPEATNTPFEIQTPSLQPSDYSGEQGTHFEKPIWHHPEDLPPEGDEDPGDPDDYDPSLPPPSGR